VGLFIQLFVGTVFAILWLLVLGRVVLTWIDPTGKSRVAGFLVRATEPMIAPVRRLLPSIGTFDVSSLVVLLVLGMLWRTFL
jgi:YggT family protein